MFRGFSNTWRINVTSEEHDPMTLYELHGDASLLGEAARPSETLTSRFLRLLDHLGGAHYDTIAVRNNRQPIRTWTPTGWH